MLFYLLLKLLFLVMDNYFSSESLKNSKNINLYNLPVPSILHSCISFSLHCISFNLNSAFFFFFFLDYLSLFFYLFFMILI